MTVLARTALPCSPSELEHLILRAAHDGHWEDAEVQTEDTELVLVVKAKS